jgi:hypothetical protein
MLALKNWLIPTTVNGVHREITGVCGPIARRPDATLQRGLAGP